MRIFIDEGNHGLLKRLIQLQVFWLVLLQTVQEESHAVVARRIQLLYSRRPKTRLKEHQKTCSEGTIGSLDIAQHMHQHTPSSGKTLPLWTRPCRGHRELQLKVAIRIGSIPPQEWFNCDEGTELQAYWLTALTAYKQRTSGRARGTSGHVPRWHICTLCVEVCTDSTSYQSVTPRRKLEHLAKTSMESESTHWLQKTPLQCRLKHNHKSIHSTVGRSDKLVVPMARIIISTPIFRNAIRFYSCNWLLYITITLAV